MGNYLQGISKKILLIFFILFFTINIVCAENNTDSYSNLTDHINALDDKSIINLTSDYKFDDSVDDEDGVIISKNVTVKGNVYIDGNHQARGFLIESNCNVVLEDLTFKNCFSEDDGGAIFLSRNSNLTLKNCIFNSNEVYNANGAAIMSKSTTNINIYSCIFSNNTSIRESDLEWNQFKKGMGSALCVGIDSSLNIYDSVFKNNNAYLSTILVVSYNDVTYKLSTLFIRNCLFENNTSRTNTAIYLDEFGKGEILDSIFRNNVATDVGGIVTFDASIQAVVKNCLFESNHAIKGGAIYIHPFNGNGSNVLIEGCNLSNNVAEKNGGAIYANSANLEISNSSFNQNTALGNGGAIYAYKGITKFMSLNFNNNSAKYGGAINLLSDNIIINNSIFIQNNASKRGGGVYCKKIQVSTSNCIYISNNAPIGANVYGIFHLSVKQTRMYFGDVQLSIKLSSPWKLSLAQKFQLKFLSGSKTYKTDWLETSSKGMLNFIVPFDLKCGKYSLSIKTDSWLCDYEPITINVIKAPVKLVSKKISAKYNSGKSFKVYVKNKETNNVISGACVKLKVYSGKSHYTLNLRANQNGLVEFDTSGLSLGKHVVKFYAGDKNIQFKNEKSEIKISKGSCHVVAPKKIKKHSNLNVKILTIISKKPIKKTKFQVSVNFKKYNLKTDSNGVLKIKTSKLAKGKYPIHIRLKNERYNIDKRISCKII